MPWGGGVNFSESMATHEGFCLDIADWELFPDRAIWWPSERTWIVTDVHLGKAAHFRKNGIAIPSAVNSSNLTRLFALFRRHPAKRLLVLGDLFHSSFNAEWDEFAAWVGEMRSLELLDEIRLVEGNHDVLPADVLDGAGIDHSEKWSLGPFDFVHDPKDADFSPNSGRWLVYGHIHPAIRLQGKAKQSLRLPCWWLSSDGRLALPSFGSFTGSVVVKPGKKDRCWVTTGQQVFSVGE